MERELATVRDALRALSSELDRLAQDGGTLSADFRRPVLETIADLVTAMLTLRRECRGLSASLHFEWQDRRYFEKHPSAVDDFVRHWSASARSCRSHLGEADFRFFITESMKRWPRQPATKPPYPHLQLVT